MLDKIYGHKSSVRAWKSPSKVGAFAGFKFKVVSQPGLPMIYLRPICLEGISPIKWRSQRGFIQSPKSPGFSYLREDGRLQLPLGRTYGVGYGIRSPLYIKYQFKSRGKDFNTIVMAK